MPPEPRRGAAPIKCPVCRAPYRSPLAELDDPDSALSCHRCGADLTSLIQLHDQAIGYHRRALQALQVGDYPAATAWNEQALTLHQNADFHTLRGQLWALQGQFRSAIAAWEVARRLAPQHPAANAYLRQLEQLASQQIGEEN